MTTDVWLMGFFAGVVTAFVSSTVFSVVLMMVARFDEPDLLE